MNFYKHFRQIFIFVFAAAIFCGGFSFVAAQDEEDKQTQAVEQFESAQTAHERGDFAEALKFYEKAVELHPEFPEAEFQRGVALQQLGRNDEAEKAFCRAVELNPDWSLPLSKLGALLVRKNNFVEAEKILSRAIELDANNSPALIALAELRLNSKAAPEKLKDLLFKIKNQTDGKIGATAALWAARAALERSLNDRAAAKSSVSRALQIEPNNLATRIERAELLLAENDFAAALDDAQFAVKTAPADLAAQILLVRVFAASGKTVESLAILDALKSEQKNKPEIINLRNTILANGATDAGSIAALETLLSGEPKNIVVLSKLCALTRTINPNKSLDYCRRALELEPTNAAHAIGFGAALVQARRFAEAITILSRILAVVPENYTARANLATAFYEAKKYAEAVTEFNRLLEVKPDVAATYFFVATAYENLGEYVEAMAAYQKFLALADAKQNQLEIDKVKLRLPQLARQIEKGAGKKKTRT